MRISSEAKGQIEKISSSPELFELDWENRVKNFLEFRKSSALSINNQICEVFMITGITDEQLKLYFRTDPKTTKIIRFVLESFSKPKNPSKARRKDGSHIAVHSLQLFVSARDYFKIKDSDVLKTLLVHDIIEDTQVSEQEIKEFLGEQEARFAFQMTEENLPAELRKGLEEADKEPEEKEKVRQALIAKFGKVMYTVEKVSEGKENEKVQELRQFFKILIKQQMLEMKSKFGLEITQSEIKDEVDKYNQLVCPVLKHQK